MEFAGDKLTLKAYNLQGFMKGGQSVFVLFFLLWVVFNGRITLEIAIFGVAFAAALYAFICAFMGYHPRKDWRLLKKVGGFLVYVGRLVWDVCLANAAVLKFILSPKYEVEPKLVTFRTNLKSDAMRALLANSITLTPGTITASVEEDRFTVHCLDAEMAEGMKDSEMEKMLLNLEGSDKK